MIALCNGFTDCNIAECNFLTVILLGVRPVLACGDDTQITYRAAIQEKYDPVVIPHKVVRSVCTDFEHLLWTPSMGTGHQKSADFPQIK
jgi:hypothetical protein